VAQEESLASPAHGRPASCGRAASRFELHEHAQQELSRQSRLAFRVIRSPNPAWPGSACPTDVTSVTAASLASHVTHSHQHAYILSVAVRAGGQLIAVRPFAGESERDITISPVLVVNYVHNGTALQWLVQVAATGKLTLRVAETLPVDQVAEAHRRPEKGGGRGRLVVTF
jgi:zinc-binding alcohol dehydrogenase family protein